MLIAGTGPATERLRVREIDADGGQDKLFGHIKPRKTRGRFLEFCRYLRSLYPSDVRIAIVCGD